MQKSFITATPDSGSGNRTVTCSASQNNTENSRSTSITVSGGGMTRTVSISQAAGTVTYEYEFSSGGEIPYTIRGWETQIYFKVYSYRRKYINGVQSGTSEVVNVSAIANSSAVTNVAVERLVNDSSYDYGVTVSFSQDFSGSNRTISVKVTQSGSGKSDIWTGTQDGSAFILYNSFNNHNYWFACTDDSYGNINMPVEVRNYALKFDSGYTFPIPVYRVYSSGSRTHMERAAYAYAGSTVSIKTFKNYTSSSTNDNQVTLNYGEISI